MLHIPADVNILILKMNKSSAILISALGRSPAARIETKILRLSIGMLLAFTPCSASIVLVALSGDAIYVGADGRGTLVDEAGNETPSDTCKVRSLGPFVVADTGMVSGPAAPSDTFDVWSELKSIKASSVVDFANKISNILPGRFQSVFAERSRRTGRPFQQFIPGDIAVVSFEGGRPAFVRIIFVTVNGKITANQKNDGAEFARDVRRTPGMRTNAVLGEFNLFPIGAQPECFTVDPVEEMRCQLAAYIKADPTHINEPIVIRKVTDTRSDWIVHSKPCDDQER